MSLNIELLRESMDTVTSLGDQVPAKFYQTLFENYPAAKGLFEGKNMTNQGKLLMNSLRYVIQKLDDQENLVSYLHALGARHVSYGTQDEHYEWVGASFMHTLRHFYGDNWTEELETQWGTAYGAVASLMKEGAANAPRIETPETLSSRARDLCRELLHEMLPHQVDTELEDSARKMVRELLGRILEEEYKAMSQAGARGRKVG